jgi:hypothetical protein
MNPIGSLIFICGLAALSFFALWVFSGDGAISKQMYISKDEKFVGIICDTNCRLLTKERRSGDTYDVYYYDGSTITELRE